MPPQQAETSSQSLLPSEDETSSSPTAPRKEIYYDGYFYDVTEWVRRHPGGNVIEFYTKPGEDATMAIQQFHFRSSYRTMLILKSLKKRKAMPEEMGLSPEVIKRNAALNKDFEKLTKELEEEGMFKPSHSHVLYRIAELALLKIVGLYLFLYFDNWAAKFMGMVTLAMFGGRCGWFVHECGHRSLTGYPKLDQVLCSFVMGYGDGFSAVWWNSMHNRHHAMPQRLNHDVDLRTLPLIAFNKKVVKDPKEGKGFFVQNQAKLFLFLDTLLVIANWRLFEHPRTMLKKRAYLDMFFVGLNYLELYFLLQNGVYFYQYLFVVWMAATYMLTNFALSHSHMPVTEEPTHWVEYGLSHTVDIQPSWWCDWWMGYLNYQIEHHLFPAMPQFRNPQLAPRVKALAKKHGIPYESLSYWEALKKTFSNLENVSKELRHEH